MIKEFHVGIPIVTCYKPEDAELSASVRGFLDVFCTQIRKIAVGERIPLDSIRVWTQSFGGSGYSDAVYLKDNILSMEYHTPGYNVTPHTFVISIGDLREIYELGAREYPHLKHLLPSVEGDAALVWFATHEAVHMMDGHINGESMWEHDENFEKEYIRLIEAYI